jgi:hypothetical protein
MLSSGMKRYHLEPILSSGTTCYHLGCNVPSGANIIIWDKMLSSGANVIMVSSGANVIIWCYHVMLSSGMITHPLFNFPENFTHSNWDPHPRTRRRVCPHTFGSGVGGTRSLTGEGVEGPNSDEGTDTVVL